jgi:phage I-like protein
MSGQKANIAMGVARGVGHAIAFNASGGAEEWIMLMPVPATRIVATVDGRGPYRVADAAKLASASLQAHDGRIPIDENHSTDLAAPRGEPAPARGWATELQARADGIYGKVEWSPSGAALMSEKSYRYISPVIIHDKAGNVLDLPRASLTNTPNLLGMAALNAKENETENDMDPLNALLTKLRTLLGLPDTADADAVLAKVKAECGDDGSSAMQSIALAVGLAKDAGTDTVLASVKSLKAGTALSSIAKAAGLKEDSGEAAIVAAITTLAAGVPDAVKALQAELTTVTTRLNAALTMSASEKATAFVDNAIKAGVVGVKPLRDHYIARHAADPANVEKEIGSLPKLGPSGVPQIPPPPAKDGEVALSSEQLTAAKLLGIDPKAYQKTLASEQAA